MTANPTRCLLCDCPLGEEEPGNYCAVCLAQEAEDDYAALNPALCPYCGLPLDYEGGDVQRDPETGRDWHQSCLMEVEGGVWVATGGEA